MTEAESTRRVTTAARRHAGVITLLVIAALLVPRAGDGCTNGVYVTARGWLDELPARATLDDLRARFAAARVDAVYVYRLELGSAAAPGPPAAIAATYARNLSALRAGLGGEVRVVAMIGKRWSPERILAAARSLWDIGFDGVQIDYEPLASGNRTLPEILALLGRHKPAGRIVSLATYLLPDPRLRKPAGHADDIRVWSPEYIAELIALVDDVMVMNYDTNIRDRATYVAVTADQVAAFGRLAAGRPVRLNIGLITNVPGRSGFFSREAENVLSGLDGVRAAWPHCAPDRGVTLFTLAGAAERDWRQLADWANATPPRDG